MALIYGLVRAIAVALTKMATWQHRRAMKQLENADATFRETETSCKAEEVSVGRPVDYPSQIKLLRQYEKREAAHVRWQKAANRLKKRKRVQHWLAELSGRKVPYTFGLIDMALATKLVELGYRSQIDFSIVADWLAQWY